jgi:uncharacterized membrane protein
MALQVVDVAVVEEVVVVVMGLAVVVQALQAVVVVEALCCQNQLKDHRSQKSQESDLPLQRERPLCLKAQRRRILYSIEEKERKRHKKKENLNFKLQSKLDSGSVVCRVSAFYLVTLR